VDPNGQLYYSGYNINDIAKSVSYEEVVHLLWHNRLPNKKELSTLRARLTSEMQLAEQVNRAIEGMVLAPQDNHPMDILRSAVSFLGLCDPDVKDNSESANMRKAIRIIAKMPTIVANLHRISTRKPIID